MREIKFRGKNIHNSRWKYGYLLKNVNDDYMIGYKEKLDKEINQSNLDIYHILEIQVDDKTIGQYTRTKR
jgi:hypothetical protein